MGRLEVELRRHSGVLWLRRGSAEQCFLDLKHGSGEGNQDQSGMESNPSTDRHRRVCLSQWSRPLGIWGTRSSVKISVLWVPTRFQAVTLLPAKELPPEPLTASRCFLQAGQYTHAARLRLLSWGSSGGLMLPQVFTTSFTLLSFSFLYGAGASYWSLYHTLRVAAC